VNEVTQAPTWLLNACQALEYLTSEHPKVMSTISAILITVGSIPALPAVAAGAGGAVLASAGAHAAGAIAVGVGSLLQGATHARQASNTATASSRSR
jgi:flagellar biosynthesis component FlhA